MTNTLTYYDAELITAISFIAHILGAIPKVLFGVNSHTLHLAWKIIYSNDRVSLTKRVNRFIQKMFVLGLAPGVVFGKG